MIRKLSLLFFLVSFYAVSSSACTNFLIGKNASADGSTIVTYNMDSYGMYGKLPLFLPPSISLARCAMWLMPTITTTWAR